MSNKNKSKYNLSATEMEIMEYVWSTDNKLIAAEILNYFNENKSKNWKKQTLNTFLVKLIEKGALQYDVSKNKKYYYPTAQSQTKTEHIKHWTFNLIQFIICITGKTGFRQYNKTPDILWFLQNL